MKWVSPWRCKGHPESATEKAERRPGDDLRPATPERQIWGKMLGVSSILDTKAASEQSRLIDIAEFNIARHVAYCECRHFEFCRLDSLVIQPYAHVAHQQPDRTAGKRRDTNEH